MGLLALGALSGFGNAVKDSAAQLQKTVSEAYLMGERQKYDTLRDERRQGFEEKILGKTQAHQEKTQERGIEASAAQQERGLKHATDLQLFQFQHTEAMQAGTFAHGDKLAELQHGYAKGLAEMSIAANKDIHSLDRASHEKMGYAAIRAAKDKVTLVPQADGTLQRIDANGNVKGVAMGSDGKPIQGLKDLTGAAKVLAEMNIRMMHDNSSIIKNPLTDPALVSALREENKILKANTERFLLGKEAPAAEDLKSLTPDQARQIRKDNPNATDAEIAAGLAKKGYRWDASLTMSDAPPLATPGILNSGPSTASPQSLDSATQAWRGSRGQQLP